MMNDELEKHLVNDKEFSVQLDSCARHSSFIIHHSSLLFFAIWPFLLLAGRSAMLRDPGSFWHLVDGQKMLAAGHVLRDDSFSFTFGGRPWVADQWLAECGMAAVYEMAGWDGLLLLAAALLAAVYTWIASRLLRAGLHWLPAALLLAILLLIGAPQFHVRPLIVTLGLLAVTFAWMVDVEAGRRQFRQLWWLVPLFVLWTNLHGGVLAGVGTAGLCMVGWCITSVWSQAACRFRQGWGSSSTATPTAAACRLRNAIEPLALLVALAASTLINPYGLGLPRDWLRTLTMPLRTIIMEHAPLNLSEPIGWATALLAVGYLAVLIGVLPRRPRITWLVPLVWLVLAFQRVRSAPLFAVTAAIALADMLPYSRVGDWLKRREMLTSEPVPECGTAVLGCAESPPTAEGGCATSWRPAVLPAIVVASALAIQMAGIEMPVIGRGWARFDRTHWPVDLLPQLEEINRTSQDGTRIFNDLSLGGFLIYHAPRLRVFIDDRCSLYDADFLQAYDRARREAPTQIDLWRRQYGFSYALVETDGNFDRHLAGSASWTPLAHTPVATLYRHR